jgi:hypothetical protein
MKRVFTKAAGLVLFFMTGMTQQSLSQNVDIDFIELVGRNVVVHYNLDDGANSSRQFLVQLYSSQDNFTTPLTRVSGDFGSEVSAGIDKKIVWDVTQELGSYKGNISLEIRGRVYVPFVKIKDIDEDQVFKRGKNYPVNWTSGNLSGQVNIELFNAAGERIWGENNVPNVGKFDWYVQGNIKKGKNYKLKFTNIKDRNDVAYSLPFAIKPKIPLLVKVAGVLIIAAGIEILSTNAKSNSEIKPLVGPPAAPNN